MQLNLMTIILLCLVIAGIVWVYPKLPWPANLIFVIVIAVICLVILLSLAGVNVA
jgi:hypothetical protein